MAEHNTRFECDTLQNQLKSKNAPAVTYWNGREAVSQPYRFEVTLAIPHDELDPQHPEVPLELLLDQAATLYTKKPDGREMCWHGVITEAAQAGIGEEHDFYRFVLEPRLARLRCWHWSDVYLNKSLSDLIHTLLAYAGVGPNDPTSSPYSTSTSPKGYQIKGKVPGLAKKEFVCQFEETCLDFLMRQLEHYGVYFWFEQGAHQEAIVFADSVDQQPQNVIEAVYYPKGEIDPDAREIALMRLDRQIRTHPKSVTLHASPVYGNTTQNLVYTENSPMPTDSFGLWHSYEDQFEKVDASDAISAKKLATWRAQEQLCDSLRVNGEARTPGLAPGRFLVSHLYQRTAQASDYYVVQIEHEGYNPRQNAPESDEPPYRGRFVALPRWQDPTQKKTPIQYRPPRVTPVPRIARMVNGFVDIVDQAKPMRYAQTDDKGRYKVRFCFPRERYKGTNNSAWLRMATPYAAGASNKDLSLKAAGMHFPLREGTEVLISFINGDPDLPVIVAALPNIEAPSVVTSKNASEHLVQTPAGNVLALRDNTPETANDASGSDPSIYLYSPTANSKLTLGKAEKNGFELKTDGNGNIIANGSMLIEVPGHMRMSAGTGALNSFFSSKAQGLPPGMSIGTTGGFTMDHFFGAKFDITEGLKFSSFLGAKVDLSASLAFSMTAAAGIKINREAHKELFKKKDTAVLDQTSVFGTVKYTVGTWNFDCGDRTEKLGTSSTTAATSYMVNAGTDVKLSAGGTSTLWLTPAEATMTSSGKVSVDSLTTAQIAGDVSASLSSGGAEFSAKAVGVAAITGPSMVRVNSNSTVNVRAMQIVLKGTIIELG